MIRWRTYSAVVGAPRISLTPACSEFSVGAGVRSPGCAAPSEPPHKRRHDPRDASGQAAVEFALVVPLLCLIIIAILHFGKVMNYWLDLNHVASEGARKAAVNTFASDAEYDSYIRGRLETGELRTGGTTSIPAASTIAVCLPEGSEIGDPVTVQVAVGYSLPFIGTAVTLRGTATMRLEQQADYAGGGACT